VSESSELNEGGRIENQAIKSGSQFDQGLRSYTNSLPLYYCCWLGVVHWDFLGLLLGDFVGVEGPVSSARFTPAFSFGDLHAQA